MMEIFAAAQESVPGTTRKNSKPRTNSAYRGTADELCSRRVRLFMTQAV